jgi:hypothetical protein
MTQAIDRAHETLRIFEEGSKENKQLIAMQEEIDDLKTNVIKVTIWY